MENKLLRLERVINIYNKKNELFQKIEINIPIERLSEIIIPKEDDPLFYDGYILVKEQIAKLEPFTKKTIATNFDNYFYVLECIGIYDW